GGGVAVPVERDGGEPRVSQRGGEVVGSRPDATGRTGGGLDDARPVVGAGPDDRGVAPRVHGDSGILGALPGLRDVLAAGPREYGRAAGGHDDPVGAVGASPGRGGRAARVHGDLGIPGDVLALGGEVDGARPGAVRGAGGGLDDVVGAVETAP